MRGKIPNRLSARHDLLCLLKPSLVKALLGVLEFKHQPLPELAVFDQNFVRYNFEGLQDLKEMLLFEFFWVKVPEDIVHFRRSDHACARRVNFSEGKRDFLKLVVAMNKL